MQNSFSQKNLQDFRLYPKTVKQCYEGYVPEKVESPIQNNQTRAVKISDTRQPKGESVSTDIIKAEIAKYGWPIDIALKVANCESGFKEKIISKTGDVGIMQINLSAHWTRIPGINRAEKILWLQDYKNNIGFGWTVYERAGYSFTPWVCFTKKYY